MNNQIKSLSISTAVLCLFATLAANVAAQCVQCKPTGRVFVCSGAAKGGCDCMTIGGSSACALDGTCGTGERCAGAAHAKSGVQFTDATILEVAQTHPRFAAALVALNRIGGLKTWAQVSMIPARLESSEVVNWLKEPTEAEPFFREYRNRYVKGAKIIVIEFTLSKMDDTRSVIRGNVIDVFPNDPAATQLEIELNGGRVTAWRVY